jgi:hypothetical protein
VIRASVQAPGNILVTLIDTSKHGTADLAHAIYTDGYGAEDQINLSPGTGPGGDQVYHVVIRGVNGGGSSPAPQMNSGIPLTHSLWLWVRRRYTPGFVSKGDGTSAAAIAFNATQGAGFKISPYAIYGYWDSLQAGPMSGRGGLQTGNGNTDGTADYDLVNAVGTPSGTSIGITDFAIGRVTTEWTDNRWRDVVVYVGNYVDSAGVIQIRAAAWERVEGTGAPYTPIGPPFVRPLGPTSAWVRPQYSEIVPFSLNYNESRSTDLSYDVWGWAAFDADKYPNPFHLAINW